jgi:hypothetical protein
VVTGGADLTPLILPIAAWDGRGVEADSLDEGALSGSLAVEEPCSSAEGSAGRDPSIAHLRDSYFDLMNDSILLHMRQSPGSRSHEVHTVLVAHVPVSNVPPNIDWPDGCPISEWTVEELLSSICKGSFGQRTYLHLFGSPDVKVDRLDFTDMRAHASMNSGATDTEKHATKCSAIYDLSNAPRIAKLTRSMRPIEDLTMGAVNRHPAEKTLSLTHTIPFAVGACLVLWLLQQLSKSARVSFACGFVLA